MSATVQMKFGGPQDPARRPSKQELIDKIQEAFPNDCYGAVPGEGGFRGSPPETTFEYIKQRGVAVEANHPYCGKRTLTPIPPDSPRIWIQDYTVMKRLPETDPLYFETQPIIRRQPIVGVFLAPDSLEQHREGVYQGAKDDDDAKTARWHAVVIFGYGTENGQDYYWIQNTWGPEWGIMELAKFQHTSSFILSIRTWRASPFKNLERGAHEENRKMKSSNGSSFPFVLLTNLSR